MNRGRYPNYGMYYNKRVNKLNCCCLPRSYRSRMDHKEYRAQL